MKHRSMTVAAAGLVLTYLMTEPGVSSALAQQKSQGTGFQQRTHTDQDGDHNYQLFVPAGYSADTQWPIVVYLHGAGERGQDGDAPTKIGPGPFARARQNTFPYLVLFTQCEDTESRLLQGWRADGADAQRMLRILQEVEKEYSVDPQRRILTGWSMGGYGVWNIAAAHPDLWSALVAVSSGGPAELAQRLPNVPVWAIQGQRDNVVRPSAVTGIIDGLRSQGRAPWLSIVPESGHDVWKVAYGSDVLWNWMLAPTNEGGPPQLATDVEAANALTAGDDFRPVLEIPDAVGVRLGNRMLNAVSYAIPARVPDEAVSGRIPDIYDSTSAEGIQFAVTFSQISYSGHVTRARLRAVGKDRLNLQFGLTDVSLTIGSTYVRGGRRAATAGPITVGIGTRRPVWLNVDAEPYVQDRKLKLRALSSSFRIERDNWYVTRPYGVSVRGWGMTRSRVSDALVQGLYSRRNRIEREVEAAVPSILHWVEDVLDLSDVGQATDAVWPLPVYHPVAKAWPQAISTDSNGVSITMGLDVAAPTNRELAFRVAEPGNDELSAPGSAETLQIGISPRMLRPLTELLVESNVARINVLDIPGEAFVDLTRRDRLIDVIPELADYPEDLQIQTELVLLKPMNLERESSLPDPAATSGAAESEDVPNGTGVLHLNAPDASLRIAVRESGGSEWIPAAEFALSVSQRITAEVNRAEESSDVRLLPADAVQVSVPSGRKLIAGESAADEAARTLVATMFSDAWTAWISGETFTQTQIAALDFQQTRLQLQDILFAESIVASFDIPPVRIANLTDEVHSYELKGPASGWGGPYQLEPGKSVRFDLDYSLSYRWTANGKTTEYTLKPGSESEFRVPQAGGPPTLFRKRR